MMPVRDGDPVLGTYTAEDIALGYKQLLQVERGWRDMKTTLELRPVYHRLEDRIRAHIILCWLALLLVRLVETITGDDVCVFVFVWRSRLSDMIVRGERCEHERVGIDGTAGGWMCTRGGIQRVPRGIEGGIGAPSAETVADG
jgi:hypothetical protein